MEYAPDNEEPTQHQEPVEVVQGPQPNLPYVPPTESSPPSGNKSVPQSQSPQKDSGFIVQLSEKVRQQAKLLEEQETYKILCEKRILELCPEHPLPVLPGHLGKPFSTSPSKLSSDRSSGASPALQQQIAELRRALSQKDQDMHYMKQRSEKLQFELEQMRANAGSSSASGSKSSRGRSVSGIGKSISPERRAGPLTEQTDQAYKENCMSLINRVSQLQKEKQTLEESLRAEILANEEQRNYSQILKEALESKIEDLGFTELINQARAGKPTAQAVDIFAEMAVMKKNVDQHRKEQAKYESAALELEAQFAMVKRKSMELERENEELKKKLGAFQEDLNNSLQALEQTRQINGKLEEEKNSLLDYVEEMTAKHDQLAANLESLNILHKKVAEEKLAGDKHIEDLEKGLKGIEGNFRQELDKRDAKLENYRQQVDKYKEQIVHLKTKCEEKAQKISEAINRLETDKELSQTREKELQEALTSLQDIRNDSEAQFSRVKEQLEATIGEDRKALEEQVQSLREANEQLNKQVGLLTQQNETLAANHKNLKENYDALNNTLAEMQTETEQLRKRGQELAEKNKALEAANAEAQKRLQETESRVSELKKLKSENDATIVHLQEMLKTAGKGKEACSECEKYKKESKSTKEELLRLKDENARLASDAAVYKKEVQIKSEEVRLYATEKDQYRKELEQVQSSERRLRDDFNRGIKSHKETEHAVDHLNTKLIGTTSQLQDHKAEIAVLEAECKGKQREVELLTKENAELKKQLGEVIMICSSRQQHEDLVSTLKAGTDEAETRLRQQKLRNEDLMEQMNQLTSEFDSLHVQHQGTLSQVDFIKQKTEEENEHLRRKLSHVEELRDTLNVCVQIIVQFAKQFEAATATALQTTVSKRFRDVMTSYASMQKVQDLYGADDLGRKVAECVRHLIEEVEGLVKTIVGLRGDSQAQQQKIITLETRCSSLAVDEQGLRERERFLKVEADSLREEKRKLEMEKEVWYKRERQLEAEHQELRLENGKLKKDLERLEAQIRQASLYQEKSALEYKHRTLAAERDTLQVRNVEEKLVFLQNEKRDIEMLLGRIGAAMPSAEMQKVVSAMAKNITDRHMAEREKHRLAASLMQTEGILRSHVSSTATIGESTQSPLKYKTAAEQGVKLRREVEKLREDMGRCEERIELCKKQFIALEDELKTLEVAERRKNTVFTDNEKFLAQKQQKIDELSKENLSLRYGKRDSEEGWKTMEDNRASARPMAGALSMRNRSFVGTGEESRLPVARPSSREEDMEYARPPVEKPKEVRLDESREDVLNRSTLQQRLMQAKSSFSSGVNPSYKKQYLKTRSQVHSEGKVLAIREMLGGY